MPMPEPKYPDDIDDAENLEAATEGAGAGAGAGATLTRKSDEAGGTAAPSALAAWMPLMCKAAAEDIVRSAATNVRALLLLLSFLE